MRYCGPIAGFGRPNLAYWNSQSAFETAAQLTTTYLSNITFAFSDADTLVGFAHELGYHYRFGTFIVKPVHNSDPTRLAVTIFDIPTNHFACAIDYASWKETGNEVCVITLWPPDSEASRQQLTLWYNWAKRQLTTVGVALKHWVVVTGDDHHLFAQEVC